MSGPVLSSLRALAHLILGTTPGGRYYDLAHLYHGKWETQRSTCSALPSQGQPATRTGRLSPFSANDVTSMGNFSSKSISSLESKITKAIREFCSKLSHLYHLPITGKRRIMISLGLQLFTKSVLLSQRCSHHEEPVSIQFLQCGQQSPLIGR